MNIRVICCIIICSLVHASNETAQILQDFKNLTASYSLEVYNNKLQLTFKDHGTLEVSDIHELKLSSSLNKGSFVMIKDNYLWQYDHELLQLIKINLSHNTKKARALNLLDNINEYEQKKTITSDGYDLYLTHKIAGMPDLKLFVKNNMLTSVEFYDNFGYMNKLLFENILANSVMSEDTFIFTPTSDIEIIKQ